MKRQALLVSFYVLMHLLIIDTTYIFLLLESINLSVELITYNIVWVFIAIAIGSYSYIESNDQRS